MKKGLPYLAIFLFFLPIFYTLVQVITNATTDGWAHLFRQVEFDKALREGQFPPSWAGTAVFGFGNPVFLFNWTLPYYFVEALLVFGIKLIPATHIFFGFSLLGGAIVMYLFQKKFFGRLAAFVSAVVYLYAPYRLLNVFIYGAWGEILALFIGPLLLLWVVNVYDKQTRVMYFLGGILTASLILTHNVLSIMFIAMTGTLALFLYVGGVLKKNNKISLGRFWMLGLLGLVFGVLLTTFFWVPAVSEKNLIYASDLVGWSVRVANYKTVDGMFRIGWNTILGAKPFYTSFTVGIPILLMFILSLAILFFGVVRSILRRLNFKFQISNFKSISNSQMNKKDTLFCWAMGWFVLSLFMTMPISEAVWSRLPALQLFLYPYRFIAGMTVAGAIFAGFVVLRLEMLGLLGRLGILGFLVVTILGGMPYLNPIIDHGKVDTAYFYMDQPPYYPSGNWISMGNEDFLPKTVPREFLWKLQKEGKPEEMYNVQSFNPSTGSAGSLQASSGLRTSFPIFKKIAEKKSSNKVEFRFLADGDGVLTVNIFYFPGWRAWDNGKEIDTIVPDNNGRITFPVTKGEHTIFLRFTDIPIHTYSKIFSLMAFLGFLGLGIWGKRLKIFS